MEILGEEEGFQFGFKRWQGWAMSKILWEWISNVGSKAREDAKAMSLAFALLDFQHVDVRGRVLCTRRSVDMQQLREVSRTRTTYSTETHTSDFILNTFWNGKPVQFFQRLISSLNAFPVAQVNVVCLNRWLSGGDGVRPRLRSRAAKFWIFWRVSMTELGVPMRRQLQ